jgi:glyoxalase superfamily protein
VSYRADSVPDMAVAYKICIDCADPHRLAPFWADALGYVVEDYSSMIRSLLDQGHATDADVVTVDGRLAWRTAQGIRDPDGPVDERTGIGRGGRVLFQVVPEPKTVKNRVHLDLHIGPERRAEVVAHLVQLGGSVLWEGHEFGSSWVTMADPEGNEFCVA